MLKAAVGVGVAAGGAAIARFVGWPAAREPSTEAARPAHRVVAQAEEFWGLTSSEDQWMRPVTTGWTWVSADRWQLPRIEETIVGPGAFLNGAAAGTVAPGRMWQDVQVPAAGRYRVFLRVVDYGHGVNRIRVRCGDAAHAIEWGGRPAALAWILRRVRRIESLLRWVDAGTFVFDTTTPRIAIEAERVEQPILFVDALYATSDADEGPPRWWNPRARRVSLSAGPVKRRRTVVPDERIAVARENVRRHDWARAEAAAIAKAARSYADRSDEEIWRLMPSSAIARAASATDPGVGCPIHGARFGGWIVEPFAHPFQLQCPVGKEWYPPRLDGRDDQAVEREARREAGRGRPRFVRHYCHRVFLDHVRPAAEALARAYAVTNESAYGHKAAVLLCRVASEYPDSFTRRDLVNRPPYGIDSGMFLDNLLSGYDLTAFGTAYDLIFDVFERDRPVVDFVRSRVPGVETAAAVRCLIEERLLRTMALAVVDGAISGNPGAFETGVATVALCLDDVGSGRFPDSREMIRSLYYDRVVQRGNWGTPARYVSNVIHPNGCTDSSVDYGSLVGSFADFGERIDRLRKLHPDVFPEADYPSPLRNPRLRRHVDFLTDVACLQRYHPALGDGNGKGLWTGDNLVPAQSAPRFETLASPELMLELLRANPDAALAGLLAAQADLQGSFPRDLFDEPRESAIRELARGARPRSREAALLDDHGVVLIRAGDAERARVLMLSYYSGSGDHRHIDPLTIGLFGHGLDLLPELPYLDEGDWRRRAAFEAHPLTHNTITFDRTTAADPPSLEWLHETPTVSAMCAASVKPPGGSRYARRTCALVSIDDRRWYVVEHLHAEGGREHHLSYHVPIAKAVDIDGVALNARPGTLASEGAAWGDATGAPESADGLHPFCFMTNVSSGAARGEYAVTHRLGDARDVHLRLWGVVPPDASLTFADARPPVDAAAYTARYMFVHRRGAPPLASQFVHVLEPYEGSGFITRVERVAWPANPAVAAVRVTMADRIDLCLFNPVGARIQLPDGSTTDGVFFHESRPLDRRPSTTVVVQREPIRLEILAVFRGDEAILVPRAALSPAAVLRAPVRIHRGSRSAMYRVTAAETVAGDRMKLTLDRSSMLGEGRALGFEDGVVLNSVPIRFAGPGCRLEAAAGSQSWLVRELGHVGHQGPDVLVAALDGAPPARADLERDFAGAPEFSVHAYGAGDLVDVSLVTVR